MTDTTKRRSRAKPQGEAARIMDLIESATMGGGSIDMLDRLMGMHKEAQAREAKIAFTEAKRAMYPHLPSITRKGTLVTPGREPTAYARFEDIHEAVMPIVTDAGFDLWFRNDPSPDGTVRVTTVLDHSAGHREETCFELSADDSDGKNGPQAIASSTSYSKRYGLTSILNIRIAGEDDDAKTAVTEPRISAEQRAELQGLIDAKNLNVRSFLNFMDADALADIPAKAFAKAHQALKDAQPRRTDNGNR